MQATYVNTKKIYFKEEEKKIYKIYVLWIEIL